MTIRYISTERGSRLRSRTLALTAALALPLAGCNLDSLLEVQDPDVATPTSLQGRAALPVLLAGAVADFQVAFSGTSSDGANEGIVNLSGLLADEFHYVSTFPTRVDIDQRSIQKENTTLEGLFRTMHRARASAERAEAAYAQHGPTAVGRAEALNLGGFSFVLFGETFCSGVPMSTLTETGGTVFGDPLSTQQLFERAVAKFDSAAAIATEAGASGATQLNLARVGKARALLNLNRAAEAAAAVAGVPTAFVYNVQHSENTARQQNGTFALTHTGRRFSVSNSEGGGLPFRTANDPRVPQALGTGTQAQGTAGEPLFLQRKYTTRAAHVVLASGVEAELIRAEAALRAGDAGWLTILNDLRASPPAHYAAATFAGIGSLPQLADPGTAAARQNLLFQERAYWMWLTGHRLGDLRRLVRQYDRTQAEVFPSGAYHKGGVYGSDVNLPVPMDEENNPRFTQCLNRDA